MRRHLQPAPLTLLCEQASTVCASLPPCPAGVILCWTGLFAPGIILIFGILPFWGAFRCAVWNTASSATCCMRSCSSGTLRPGILRV